MKLQGKFLGLLVGAGLVLSSALALAQYSNTIQWLSDTRFQVGPIILEKPTKKWDTTKIHADKTTPYKFVLHMRGPNPVCYLQFSDKQSGLLSGSTAHAYARGLKGNLQSKGISGIRIKKKNIAGRNVALVEGFRGSDSQRMVMGAWRNKHMGINLQCFGPQKKWHEFGHMFDRFINTARIVRETY